MILCLNHKINYNLHSMKIKYSCKYLYKKSQKHGKSRHLAKTMVFPAIAEYHSFRDFRDFVNLCCPYLLIIHHSRCCHSDTYTLRFPLIFTSASYPKHWRPFTDSVKTLRFIFVCSKVLSSVRFSFFVSRGTLSWLYTHQMLNCRWTQTLVFSQKCYFSFFQPLFLRLGGELCTIYSCAALKGE